jgi:hypothetical protein
MEAGRVCPFCNAAAPGVQCAACGRDTTAARRPCATCGRMRPSSERACWNCGAVARSELRWKVPLIVLMFLAAFALSLLLRAL